MSRGVTIYALTTAIIGFFSVVALLLLLAPVELCNNVLPGVMLPVNSKLVSKCKQILQYPVTVDLLAICQQTIQHWV